MHWAYSPSYSCSPHGSCVDGHMDYSCDCISRVQMEVVSGEKVCGNIDDCEPNPCGDGNCVDKVNDYTCNCDADHQLMLRKNDSMCVAKKGGTSLSRAWFSRADDDVVRGC